MMVSLFTTQQRQNIYDSLIQQLKADNRITGVIAMGTAHHTFSDEYDSIDLLVIIEKPSIIDIIFTLWIKRLEDLFQNQTLYNFIITEDLNHVTLLLDNYLQISLQFRAVNRFNLVGDDWCLVFDHKQLVQNYLDKRNMTREQYVHNLYTDHVRKIWQPVISCVRELQRDNLWKALAELERLRRHTVEIAGLRHMQFTHNYENLDLLPEMFLVQLRHTVPTNFTNNAIRRSLKMTLGLLFAEMHELDLKFESNYTETLEKHLNHFVDIYI